MDCLQLSVGTFSVSDNVDIPKIEVEPDFLCISTWSCFCFILRKEHDLARALRCVLESVLRPLFLAT